MAPTKFNFERAFWIALLAGGVAWVSNVMIAAPYIELDYGGAAYSVHRSWWGLFTKRRELSVLRITDFKDGPPYRPLNEVPDSDWYIIDRGIAYPAIQESWDE